MSPELAVQETKTQLSLQSLLYWGLAKSTLQSDEPNIVHLSPAIFFFPGILISKKVTGNRVAAVATLSPSSTRYINL